MTFNTFYRYFGRHEFYHVRICLGDKLVVSSNAPWTHVYPNCKLIKVTRKGFNILNLDTNRVLLQRHLYALGMGGKEYPTSGAISKTFLVSSNWSIKNVSALERKALNQANQPKPSV